MIDPKSEIYLLLYTNEDGEEIGLEEVQLLDPPIASRISDLIELLSNNDIYIVYQSTLILASWGINEGIEKLEEFIDTKIHRIGRIDPDRINGRDNVYDNLSEAVDYYELSGGDTRIIERLYKKILNLFPDQFFRGRIQVALQSSSVTSKLLFEISTAIEKTVQNNLFQASLLLPALAKHDNKVAHEIIKRHFHPKKNLHKDAMENVAEALQFIPSKESFDWLNTLLNSSKKLVVSKAETTLNILNQKN